MARQRALRRRVSQADVARVAGVSTGIVSSVINNKSYGSIRVSDATRERVLAAVRELGYVPDPVARRMAGGSNRLIGVFTYEAMFPTNAQSFYHEFLVGIEEAAEEAEHNLLLLTGSRHDDRRSLYAGGVNGLRLADGGLLFGTSEDTNEVRRLAEEGFPFVVVGERDYPGVEASYSAADYISGTAALVHEAYQLGHRRIAMVNTHNDPVPGRVAGFLQARDALGLSEEQAPLIDVRGLPEGDAGGEEAAREVVASGATVALLQGGHWLAAFLAEARRRGRSVPQDLSLVVLRGDQPVVDGVALTDLDIPRNEMGREAVRLLLQLIADPDAGPLRVRLPCGIHEGSTLVPPPARHSG